MEKLNEMLRFDQERDSFEWFGTDDELIHFINLVLEVAESEHGELTSDKIHNSVSYKVKGCFVRFYLTTNKLVLNGPNHASLKETLLRVRSPTPATDIPSTVEPRGPELPESPSSTLSIIYSELIQLRQEVKFIKSYVCGNEIDEGNPEQQLQKIRHENCHLQAEVKRMKEVLCKVEDERASLLTALNLLQRDNELKTKGDHKRNTPVVVDSRDAANAHGHRPPRDLNDSAAPDADSSDETEGWTKVQKKSSANPEEILLIGDSIIKNLQPTRMSRKKIKKKVYSGSEIQEIKAKEANLPAVGVKIAIIHAGTNNLSDPDQTPTVIAGELDELALSIQDRENCNVIVSGIITRNDNDFDSKVKSTNHELRKLCKARNWVFTENSNIDDTCINRSGLHLNEKGDSLLATNLICALRGKPNNASSNRRRGSVRSRNDNRGTNFQERDARVMWNFLQLMGRQR